jgi:predicted extracellular nuclease
MPVTSERQFSIAAANIETFVDDDDDPDIREDIVTTEAFQKRLGKISMAVRDHLQLPDVFAVVEAENLNFLKKLAAKINADMVASGKPDPKYEAYLFDGNDGRGIDCGFLVKSTRVSVVSAKQFGKSERFKNPVTGSDDILNDRPPLMLELTISDPRSGQPFAFTIVNNHLKSLRGVDDPKDGQAVRTKKRLQAEFLAKWVNERQQANTAERILLVGDFNAFPFNDGLVDQIGTIIGKPAPKDAVLESSRDLVETDLIDLVNLIKVDQQYSYTFDGNAQVLDHFLANLPIRKHLAGFGYLRINTDYPQILRAVGDRPERFSDHDVAVGYFTFDAPAAGN